MTLYNFYKIELFEVSNKINAQLAYTKIDFNYTIIASTLELAADLFT